MVNATTQFGSLLVDVRIDRDPLLKRDGEDLHVTIPISIKTAIFGGVAKVPTLKGTQPEAVKRMVGEGIGGRGSLFVHYKVIVPRSLSKKEKGALQQFDETYMKGTIDLWGSNLRAFETRMGSKKK
jgi:molecular chaperone DnaJ